MDLKVDKSTNQINGPPLKACSGCHTTRTPLWRGGPAGPKSLCNACGIKYNKRRRQLLGLSAGKTNRMKKRKKMRSGAGDVGEVLKMRFRALGSDVVLQRSMSKFKLREEERAAIVLMALSVGVVPCSL